MSCGVMSGGVGTPMLENSVPSGVSMSQQPAEVRLRTVRRGMGRGPLESRHDEPAPEAAPPGLDWIDAQPWVGPSGEGWLQDDSSHDTTPMLENAVAEAEVQMAHEVTHESLPLPEDYEDRAEPAADSRDPVASMLRSIDEGGGQPGPRNHERSRSRSRRVPRQPTVPPPLVPRQPTVPPPLHMARQETTGEKRSRWQRENEAFFDQTDSDWKEDDVDVLPPRRRRHRRGSRHHRRHHRGGTSCSVSPPRRRRSTGRRGSRHNRGECQTQTQRQRSPAHDDADDVEEKGPDGRTIWSRATASMVELMERPSPPRPEGQQSPEAAEAAVAGPQVADGGDTDANETHRVAWRHRRRRSEQSARARSRPRPSGTAAEAAAPARALRPARDFGLSHQVTHFRSVLRPQPPSVPPPEPAGEAAEAPASELSAPARSVPPPPPSVPPPPCMAPAAAAENALPGWSYEEVEVHRPPASAPARSVLRPQPPPPSVPPPPPCVAPASPPLSAPQPPPPSVPPPPPCVAPDTPPLSAQARSLLLSPVPTTRRASGGLGHPAPPVWTPAAPTAKWQPGSASVTAGHAVPSVTTPEAAPPPSRAPRFELRRGLLASGSFVPAFQPAMPDEDAGESELLRPKAKPMPKPSKGKGRD